MLVEKLKGVPLLWLLNSPRELLSILLGLKLLLSLFVKAFALIALEDIDVVHGEVVDGEPRPSVDLHGLVPLSDVAHDRFVAHGDTPVDARDIDLGVNSKTAIFVLNKDVSVETCVDLPHNVVVVNGDAICCWLFSVSDHDVVGVLQLNSTLKDVMSALLVDVNLLPHSG